MKSLTSHDEFASEEVSGPSFVIIRTPRTDWGDNDEKQSDKQNHLLGSHHISWGDLLLVQMLPFLDEKSRGSLQNCQTDDMSQFVWPIFSMEEYRLLIQQLADNYVGDSGQVALDLLSPLKKLFSFPLPDCHVVEKNPYEEEEKEIGSIDSSNGVDLVTVFEVAVNSESELSLLTQSLNEKIATNKHDGTSNIKGLSYRVSTMDLQQLLDSNRWSNKHETPVNKDTTLARHIFQLYLHHQIDSRIQGRRLLHGTSGSNLSSYTLRPNPAVIFFDCDDCLYFDNWNIAGHLTTKIEDHCQTEFGLPKGYAYTLYKEHGTALRGLIAEGYLSKDCSNSMDSFLNKVHDLPIRELLDPDGRLRDMVSSIHPSIRKFVFTASVSHHAQRCLEALGIADLFDGIIDVKDCQFETKHSVSSFHIAMSKAGIDDPEACIFLDDSVKNIKAGREVGWRCVLVGRVGRDCGTVITSEHAEHEIDVVHDLPLVFPELFCDRTIRFKDGK